MVDKVRSSGSIVPLQSASAIRRTKKRQEQDEHPVFQDPKEKNGKRKGDPEENAQENSAEPATSAENETVFHAVVDDQTVVGRKKRAERRPAGKIDVRV